VNDLLQISGPTWGEPDTAAADRIEAALGADAIERRVEHRGELTLDLPLDRYIEVCTHLRDHEGYDLLSDVTVVDYLGYAVSATFAKVMTVTDGNHRRLRVRVWVEDGESVPSLVPVYPSADFHEREAFDMLGIDFAGHPNLRRILMPDDWGGHPQRKDYPIGGEPVQFSDEV
jgi:NADH-quinone oxidoreductase subunit C